MCGITGFIDFGLTGTSSDMQSVVSAMSTSISHRGPDGCGTWVDREQGVALGHRRLSIIDLSQEGAQPMASACGRYVIVFNGEVYNFRSMRRELEAAGAAPEWRGYSDTELMLAAISHLGLEKAVESFIGMFAFALWDKAEETLSLVRDRMGEKPLFYGWGEGVFLFGSELKAMMTHPQWRGDINRDALALFLRYSSIPAPHSIFKRVFKVQPGTIVRVSRAELLRCGREPVALPAWEYWSARAVAEQGAANPFDGSEDDAVNHLEHLLRDAIRQQMVADVPLGAFLSGGVDSSMIVALMQAMSSKPVRTFTIGFDESGYNEAEHAKAVAHHLGTDHTEMYLNAADALAVIERLPTLYDEPFADSSQIPTHLVAEMTKKHVTVSLSGDGGDELFAGYNRYFLTQNIWKKFGWIPVSGRKAIGSAFRAVPAGLLNGGLGWLSPRINKYGRSGHINDKLNKLFAVWCANSPEQLYARLVSHWRNPASVVMGACEPTTVFSDASRGADLREFLDKMMFFDQVCYLPDDILVKVDRAAMGVSLETRIPLLDHRVVEFAWKVPLHMKVRNGQGKWLARQVLYKYVPKDLIERPKMGFEVPVADWLKGPLKEWAESLLDEKRLSREGLFDPARVREKWQQHLSGEYNWHYRIWDVLMFQSWLETHSAKVSL